MSKVTLNNIARPDTPGGTQLLNENFQRIMEAFDNTLSLDGTLPNSMNSDFDMNSHDILNAGNIDVESISINGSTQFANSVEQMVDFVTQAENAALQSEGFADDAQGAVTTIEQTIETIIPNKVQFIGDGIQTTFDLGQAAASVGVDAYVNGLYIQTDQYSLVGNSIVFDVAPGATPSPGNPNIEIRVGAQASISSGSIPPNNSIGAAQLIDGSVTNPKLAPNSVTLSKFDAASLAQLRDAGQLTGTLANTTLPPRLQSGTNTNQINDWNTATENGWYVNIDAAGQLNGPQINKRYMGEVISFNNDIAPTAAWQRQKVWEFEGGSTSLNTLTFQRDRQGSGAWSAWYRVENSIAALDARYSTSTNKKAIQTYLEFYRNPQTALIGTASAAAWLNPGNAFSASTARWRGDLGFKVLSARWVITWTPGPSSSSSGLRLCWAEDGPTNIIEFARLTGNGATTPIVSAADVTAALNGQNQNRSILHQTLGNGSNGVQIYSSVIEIVFDTAA